MTLRPLISRLLHAGSHSTATAVPAEVMPETVTPPAQTAPATLPTRATEERLIQTIQFGDRGNDTHYLGIGWATGDRFRWLAGSTSEIWLENPGPGAHFVLELDLEAERSDTAPYAQRVSVTIRGVTRGRCVVGGRQQISYHIPGDIVAAPGPIRIALQHEDVRPPGLKNMQTQRLQAPLRCYGLRLWHTPDLPHTHPDCGAGLSVADLTRLCGMPADNLMCLFESLGDNCEFGTAQRLCGAEPLGLLRFGAPRLPRLLECLRTRFAHFGAIENLEFTLGRNPTRREYEIREKRYGMMYHTFQFKGEIDESTLIPKQAARLKLLVRKLLEDLEDGQKIFVWKDTSRDFSDADAMTLHAELATFAHNTLLWVTLADEAHRTGSVEWMAPGLLKGYIHRFSDPVPDVDLPPWLELCLNAYLLVQAQRNTQAGMAHIAPPVAPKPKIWAQPLLPAPAVAHGMAHVQNRGDVRAGADGWIGVPESGKAIEGLVILDDPEIPYNGFTYQVVHGDGSLSEPATVSVFRGTRAKNQPLRGLLFSLSDERAASVRMRCEVRFVDGLYLHDVAPGTVCKAESGAPLEAFRLTVEPVS
jgi:hypothetical protein